MENLRTNNRRLYFLTLTFAETFTESKLRLKYLLKSKSGVMSLSWNRLQLLTSAEQKHGDGLHSSINTYSLVN